MLGLISAPRPRRPLSGSAAVEDARRPSATAGSATVQLCTMSPKSMMPAISGCSGVGIRDSRPARSSRWRRGELRFAETPTREASTRVQGGGAHAIDELTVRVLAHQRQMLADDGGGVRQVPVEASMDRRMVEVGERRIEAADRPAEALEQRRRANAGPRRAERRRDRSQAVRNVRRRVRDAIVSPATVGSTRGQSATRFTCAIAAFCASSIARSSAAFAILRTNRSPAAAVSRKFWSRSLGRDEAAASSPYRSRASPSASAMSKSGAWRRKDIRNCRLLIQISD